eukprot:TRINITY_DN8898_c0_g1_i1.p2 TRINITY_DN8898_c0_g1~~TRINITY_DN8898_c0_g1_i1.p2  ORF type:complete len:204 (+),score=87.30 TRINITY_DN8898_c0_g1_i1:61-672(+)
MPKGTPPDAARRGGLVAAEETEHHHAYIPNALVDRCRTLFEHFNPEADARGMLTHELAPCLRAMGLEYTENQVKDMMFDCCQSAAVTRTNLAATASPEVSPDPDAGADGPLQLSFAQFLDLLGTTLEDCEPRAELDAAFRRLDADGDGVLSVADMRAAFATMANAAELERLRDDEIEEMLNEVDWDDDRRVTFTDFVQVLDSN